MDPERSRIKADLSGLLEGDVHCDDVFLQMYASDASIFQIRPLGVIRPRSTADVVATIKYAANNHLTVHPRGAGTSVTGGSLGGGLVLDFSYSMRRVIDVSDTSVRLQPGVVLANLNRQLKGDGKLFGPDPATRSVSTIGSALAMNASGSHWLRYGSPRDKVRRLQFVTATGDVFEATTAGVTRITGERSKPQIRLEEDLRNLIRQRAEIIEEKRQRLPVNHAGYELNIGAADGSIDLSRLLVGSEGTLGVITEADVAIDELPNSRGVVLFFFDRLETAAKATREIVNADVVACDLLDRRSLSIARQMERDFERLIPAESEAMVLVEMHAESLGELSQRLQQLAHRIQKRKRLAFDSRITTDTDERSQFWRLTRRVIPTLYRLKGSRRALPFVEDIAVPPEQLPQFLSESHAILNSFEITASLFSHAAQGHVNFRPFLDLSNSDDLNKMEPLARELYQLALGMGGTISGNHGDGLGRTWYLRSQFGRLYDVFKEVKRIFDPQNILNPGKIVDEPQSSLQDNLRKVGVAKHLLESVEDQAAIPAANDAKSNQTESSKSEKKRAAKRRKLAVIQPQLEWDFPEMAMAARNCNGCGRCRTSASDQRMCPIFRLAPVEEATPRAKANLVRGLLNGELSSDTFTQSELKMVADLCVNCHQCRFECPASVDIPKLMVETKAQYVSINGLKMSQWILTRLDYLYAWGGRLPWLTNFFVRSRFSRWMIDRFLGIAQGRKLPKFSSGTLMRWAARNHLNRMSRQEGRKVLYFVDAFANWNDVELGRAFVEVLKHNGVEVFVPTNQSLSGMSLVCEGLVTAARKLAQRNVELLADAVRQGYQIVTTEPSAALAIKHEYLHLLSDQDAELVAENTTDCSSYLWNMHLQGQLELDFKPVNATIGYHLPCHQRALNMENPGLKLLNLIPGLIIEGLDSGCSGMAGTFGLKRTNYRRSLRAGVGLIGALRNPEIMVGTTECSTCKIQMEHGTVKPTVHPVKILALAYQLMPELNNLFNRRSGERVLS